MYYAFLSSAMMAHMYNVHNTRTHNSSGISRLLLRHLCTLWWKITFPAARFFLYSSSSLCVYRIMHLFATSRYCVKHCTCAVHTYSLIENRHARFGTFSIVSLVTNTLLFLFSSFFNPIKLLGITAFVRMLCTFANFAGCASVH